MREIIGLTLFVGVIFSLLGGMTDDPMAQLQLVELW